MRNSPLGSSMATRRIMQPSPRVQRQGKKEKVQRFPVTLSMSPPTFSIPKMPLLNKSIPNLIICGDYNICHEEIDIHNPKMKNVSGFLPEERKWLGGFMDTGFIDAFRFLHPERQEYSWWSYRFNARKNNKGWRIDYQSVTDNLKDKIKWIS